MRYEIKIGYPGSGLSEVQVVEAPEGLTAAYRAGLNRDTDLVVLDIRTEEEAYYPVLPPEPPGIGEEE